MIILDTNVLSELMRMKPNPSVFNWVNSQTVNELGITAITVSEILYGMGKLSEGKKKQALLSISVKIFEEDFSGRIFPFNELSAVEYSTLILKREQSGRPISMADAQIASICLSLGFPLATRNIKDFEDSGLELINPWNT